MTAESLTVPRMADGYSQSTSPALARWLRGLLRWSAQGLAWGMGLGCFLAVLLRLTWKDSVAGLAPFFYATPLPLVWIGLAVAGLLFFALRRTRPALLSGLCAVICWMWWVPPDRVGVGKETPSSAVRVVFWNTARLKAGWSPVAEQIQAMASPIMGFVEAGPAAPEDRQRWKEAFPQHHPVFFGQGMVLLVQGNVLYTTHGQLGSDCYFGRADLEVAGARMTVFLVDIHSNPFFCRKQALATLREVAAQGGSETVLVMGDFNTPADSVHLAGLRADFHNALEVAGQGTLETWPTPFPVLAIDQIWVNRKVVLRRARQDGSLHSDHRALIVELAFSE